MSGVHRYETEEMEDKAREALREAFDWLVKFGYGLGYRTALKQDGCNIGILNSKDLSFRWSISTRPVSVCFNYQGDSLYWEKYYSIRFAEFVPFTANESNRFPPAFIEEIASKVDELIKRFYPGAAQDSAIKICAVCLSMGINRPYGKLGDHYTYAEYPRVTVCFPFAGRWVCQECQAMICLPEVCEELPPEPKASQIERAKMTKTLRFEILERDLFTCKTCGRSPLTGDNIKLEVDHIHPIAKGGLTIHENLHALCEECNRGKRDKIVEQLSLLSI